MSAMSCRSRKGSPDGMAQRANHGSAPFRTETLLKAMIGAGTAGGICGYSRFRICAAVLRPPNPRQYLEISAGPSPRLKHEE